MKKIALTVVLLSLLFPLGGFGAEKLKIRSGSWMAGGTFSFFYMQAFTDSSSPVLEAGLYISSGYFMTRQTMIGLRLSFNSHLEFFSDSGFLEANLGSLTLHFRYLMSSEEPINLFFGFGAGYGLSIKSGSGIDWEDVIKSQRMLVNLDAGILIPLSPAIALEILIEPTISIPLGNNSIMGIAIPIACGISAYIY
ncbi:MAG: hypothetical protein EHM28_12690 [Spirochaetaceae bacterium]|nr:MAG: hypothetical protein EHM28_12690 [Spirochaetaceae bacterium]